jgi:hypothetical protein
VFLVFIIEFDYVCGVCLSWPNKEENEMVLEKVKITSVKIFGVGNALPADGGYLVGVHPSNKKMSSCSLAVHLRSLIPLPLAGGSRG